MGAQIENREIAPITKIMKHIPKSIASVQLPRMGNEKILTAMQRARQYPMNANKP
jgi:hypothetical protein